MDTGGGCAVVVVSQEGVTQVVVVSQEGVTQVGDQFHSLNSSEFIGR